MGIPLQTVPERGRCKMAATVEEKSDVGEPNQFGDDQKKELLPAEKKASDLNEKKEKEEGDFDDSNLPEKTRHPLGTSCKLFPLHAWLYFLYIVLAILLPIFGTLLIICGNWSNTGYFSLFAILNYPWPKLKLEDPNYTATSLELLQLACWISGFFFWLFALYLVYAIVVYHKLLWARKPWDRQAWGGVRKAADDVLCRGEVRDEDMMEQFERMDKEQQEEMGRYKRPLIMVEQDVDTKAKNIP